ncbi:hypothetical protein [Clostridioides sp. ZZV14-6345]|uniref:hypothetical protein n=1 Tax=Clostridioides sp. ZZV14-6345 TaxID=2811496 RepID=UPI001D1303D8|nr:hypothetical protein [Clostridioides sp. ZZV14-6345]
MTKIKIKTNEMGKSKLKLVLKYCDGKQNCINFKLKFSKYSYYFNLKVDKILIMNHKIPYKFPRFINIFLGKVIEILISHILMDLGIKPEFKWFVAKILAYIIIKIIKFIN